MMELLFVIGVALGAFAACLVWAVGRAWGESRTLRRSVVKIDWNLKDYGLTDATAKFRIDGKQLGGQVTFGRKSALWDQEGRMFTPPVRWVQSSYQVVFEVPDLSEEEYEEYKLAARKVVDWMDGKIVQELLNTDCPFNTRCSCPSCLGVRS